MEKRDIGAFMQLIAGIGELYAKPISAALTELYWQSLKGFELQDVQRALEAHIHNPDCGQYFPKPADVVRFIEGSGETKALRAWAVVEKAIYQVGSYQSIAFDDALIHAVIEDMGGWIALCATTLKELPFRANEFQKRYMGFVIQKPNRHPQYLVGISERDNAKNGYQHNTLYIVGDAKKAKYVMITGGGPSLSVQIFTQSIAEIMQLSDKNNEDNT